MNIRAHEWEKFDHNGKFKMQQCKHCYVICVTSAGQAPDWFWYDPTSLGWSRTGQTSTEPDCVSRRDRTSSHFARWGRKLHR